MKYRDGKTHLLTEALQGMRQIKYSALEKHWENKILQSRNDELAQYWKTSLFMCFVILAMNMGPLLLACVAQSVYAWEQGGNIKASVIFASLGLFDQLEEATSWLPLLQVYTMEAWTSCVRLEKYLGKPDKEPVASHGDDIVFEKATVAWPKNEATEDDVEQEVAESTETRSMLRDVSLHFPKGRLSIISGKTGSGKSLLLAAILGEVKLLSGTIKVPTPPAEEDLEEVKPISDEDWIVPSLTAFVSQTPWVETGTVQNNITFGLPFVESRYQNILRACSLEKDIELLIDGDQTEVGPKGVTLSGGQRWRVALARALYSRAGILILDDVLSAVDAHVGKTMVEQALTGELAQGRTRILATHHAELCLPKASYHVKLHEGRVESVEAVTPSDYAKASGSNSPTIHDASETQTIVDDQVSSEDNTTVASTQAPQNQPNKRKAEEEKRETGHVKWHVYKTYLASSGAPLLWLLVVAFIVGSGLAGIARVWSFKSLTESTTSAEEVNNYSVFSHGYHTSNMFVQDPQRSGLYSDYMHHKAAPAFGATAAQGGHSVAFWIGMSVLFYVLMIFALVRATYILRCIDLSVGSNHVSLQVGRSLAMTAIGLRTSRTLFERMTHAILRAPLRWVDTNPSGRILNRFTSDTFLVDRRLPGDLGNFLSSVFQLVVTLGASLSVSYTVLIAGAVLMIIYARVASIYIGVAREVKRLNAVSHSPIYDQFSSVLSGLSTIRAFQRTNFYMNRMSVLSIGHGVPCCLC